MSAAKKYAPKALDVHDQVPLVDSLIDAAEAIQQAQEAYDITKVMLEEKAKDIRRQTSYAGVLISTVHLRGTNRSVGFEFKNAYSSTSVSQEAPLREALGGEIFDHLFTRTRKTVLKPGALEQVKALMGDKFTDLFDVEENIVPGPEFRQKIHELRLSVPLGKAVALDKVEEQFTHRPSCKVNS